MDHAPLTDAHLAFLHSVEQVGTQRLTMSAAWSMIPAGDLAFLMNAGYINFKQVFLAHKPEQSEYELSRTDKPLPA